MRSHSEAVRPSLNVTTQEEIKADGLSHHGDTDMDEAHRTSSSENGAIIVSVVEVEMSRT